MTRRRQRAAPRARRRVAGNLLVNLAADPFVNRRPVQRFKLAMWLAGVLLAVVNALLWLGYRHDSTALRTRLSATRSEIDTRSRHVVSMGEELGGLQLAAQNEQVDFLNERIAERTFPWSLLFERIAAALPDGVRLESLTPSFEKGSGSRARPAPRVPEEELVELRLDGIAKSDEELYQLMDALFASASFQQPRLHREASEGAEVQFNVAVRYRPWLAPEESHRPAVSAERANGAVAEPGATEPAAAEDAAAEESDDVEPAGGPSFEVRR